MPVNAIGAGISADQTSIVSAKKDTGEELRENFMTLLVTQLKNQDPMNPMQNAEMTSQLAQINTVSGVESLNKTMQGITGQLEASQHLQAAALIDKGVVVPGQRVLLGSEGAATPFGIDLESPATSLKASIVGASGELVQQLDLGAAKSGVHTFEWDGQALSGERMPPGAYRVNFEAVDREGNLVGHDTLHFAVVNGVISGQGPVRLDVGPGAEPVALSDIRQFY